MDRYKVLRPLGRGVSGEVFEIEERATHQRLVAKRIPISGASEDERRRVAMEIKVLKSIDHPNIVQFKDSFMDRETQIIIMEKCEQTLEAAISRQAETGKPFPAALLIEWMAELLCAVELLHSKRISHRDIKTANIFITKRNHAKLGDFGVCHVLEKSSGRAKTFVGTPYTVAPEVCNADSYDEKSDIWSLGVVFYELCCLRRPFDGGNLMAVINAITNEEPLPFGNGLDSRFEDIVMCMLRKDPTTRPGARDLLDEHLVLPESHPSHPSQDPAYSRRVQLEHGPEYAAPPNNNASPGRVRAAGERSPGSPAGGRGARVRHVGHARSNVARNVPVPKAQQRAMAAGGARASPSGASGVAAWQAVARPQQAGSVGAPAQTAAACKALNGAAVMAASTAHGTDLAASSNSVGAARQQLLSPEEHTESLRRIKSAKSRINIAEMRRQMKAVADAAASDASRAEASSGGSGVPAPGASFVLVLPKRRVAERHQDPLSAAPELSQHTPSTPEADSVDEGIMMPVAAHEPTSRAAPRDHTGSSADDADWGQGTRKPAKQPPSPEADSTSPARKDETSPAAHSPTQGRTQAVPREAPPIPLDDALAHQQLGGGVQQTRQRCHPALVASVMDVLAAHQDSVTLDDLDNLAEALQEFKMQRFGMQ